MSTFAVTIEQIRVLEHQNADALELAQVGGYRAVIPKGKYRDGEWALYIPEQAVLPADLIEELGLDGKLAGKNKDRVKAVRLRGELSQGIVCKPRALEAVFKFIDATGAAASEKDYAEELGITKWEPPIPAQMSGDVERATRMIRWSDVENIKRIYKMFEPGEPVQVTEKIHGTCICITYDAETDELFVSSKGLTKQGLALQRENNVNKNVYWRAVEKYNIEKMMKLLLADQNMPAQGDATTLKHKRIALFGEVYGQGIQDLGYGQDVGKDGPGLRIFDMNLDGEYVGAEIAFDIMGHYAIPLVPVLARSFPFDYDELWKMASGPEQVSGKELHIREGIVIRPESGGDTLRHQNPDDPERFSESRRIAKFVSEAYLLRRNATEYE